MTGRVSQWIADGELLNVGRFVWRGFTVLWRLKGKGMEMGVLEYRKGRSVIEVIAQEG